MPYKDPEKRKEATRERVRKHRQKDVTPVIVTPKDVTPVTPPDNVNPNGPIKDAAYRTKEAAEERIKNYREQPKERRTYITTEELEEIREYYRQHPDESRYPSVRYNYSHDWYK